MVRTDEVDILLLTENVVPKESKEPFLKYRITNTQGIAVSSSTTKHAQVGFSKVLRIGLTLFPW